MEKMNQDQDKADFRSTLKSTGKDKFALDDTKEDQDKVNFRDQLKSAKERGEEE